jgi:hypothetical protein
MWTDTIGMIYLRARYYRSGIGRFVTKDVSEGNYRRPSSLRILKNTKSALGHDKGYDTKKVRQTTSGPPCMRTGSSRSWQRPYIRQI